MKCPNCGQWNQASLPRCKRCGTPLEQSGEAEPAWKRTLKDDKVNQYIRVDESGETETTEDSRDQLAKEMAERFRLRCAQSRRLSASKVSRPLRHDELSGRSIK